MMKYKSLSILDLLLVAFIVCKVLAVPPIATWSWWAVLIPLWIQLGLLALIFIIFFIIAILGKI